MNKKEENKKATNNIIEVVNTLSTLTIDNKKFEVIRCYDNEEFLEVKKERKEYANIREVISKRSVIKLWGHKNFITCECSKMLRKKEEYIDTSKKMYTEKEKDKNNNYKCNTIKEATTLCNDFLKQVSVMIDKTTSTATEKKEKVEKAK